MIVSNSCYMVSGHRNLQMNIKITQFDRFYSLLHSFAAAAAAASSCINPFLFDCTLYRSMGNT